MAPVRWDMPSDSARPPFAAAGFFAWWSLRRHSAMRIPTARDTPTPRCPAKDTLQAKCVGASTAATVRQQDAMPNEVTPV